MSIPVLSAHLYRPLIAFLLFLLQLYLHFFGVKLFDKTLTPFLLLTIYLIFPIWFLYLSRDRLHDPRGAHHILSSQSVISILLGLLSMIVLYEELRKLFVEFAEPIQFSDVIPQITTLYERFNSGVFPYAPVNLPTHTAYPVYMPLHWLPVGLVEWSGIDVRWAGYIILSLVVAGYGYVVAVHNQSKWIPLIISCFLPSLVIWAFMFFEPREISVSYELVIAGYYLLLGVALYTRSLLWATIAIILCLLSRYTLVFWLPLFALLLLRKSTLKQNALVWIAILLVFLSLYVFPFLLKDPMILTEGLKYHNNAAIAEWQGYGDPPVSWSFEKGIYFAPHFKQILSGTMEHRVFITRIIQGSVMLLLCLGGIVGYRFMRWRMHWMEYCLVILYCTIGLFYFLSPLAYSYYFMVPYMLSALLCARIMTYRQPQMHST